MTTENKDKILVDVDDLEFMLGAMEGSGICAPVRIAEALNRRARSFLTPLQFQQWDIVEPKTGKNNLRAGSTAYGRAIILNLKPFVLVSEDAKFTWEKLDPDHFVNIDRAPMKLILDLNAKHGRYPIIG